MERKCTKGQKEMRTHEKTREKAKNRKRKESCAAQGGRDAV